VRVIKEMTAVPVRRIGVLKARILIPRTLKIAEADRLKLEAAARTCPIKHCLHPDVAVEMAFVYEND
jgi:hypothetical protein